MYICLASKFLVQNFVLPDIGSFLLMVILGVLAFFAEVLLARGLQLEKTNRVTNMHYIEPFLSEIWRIALSRLTLSIGGLFGSLLILVSACSTLFFGPEKEMDRDII
ncbi:hypothetical protein AQUCO_03200066v1 [Aquilegia coerulea]|uniref:Uncharacterized protein n=1 Tax=Aquilegia coerulea TaxID=218851 RepID=A0A2G5D000_AQUCA|nr:hypothetical protein AQUCO_03200066v1 [Aquilegia coerulea]